MSEAEFEQVRPRAGGGHELAGEVDISQLVVPSDSAPGAPTPPVGEQVDRATALVRRRAAVEQLERENSERISKLSQGKGLSPGSVVSVRLQVLVEHLFGGPDGMAYWEYEAAVQARFATEIGKLESEVARSRLLEGVRMDPRQQQGPPGPPRIIRRIRPE